MRFQKRIKILPGVSLNLSKSGVSASIGPPGLKLNIRGGRTKVTTGIPGTGLSHTETLQSQDTSEKPAKRRVTAGFIVFCFVLLVGFMWLLGR